MKQILIFGAVLVVGLIFIGCTKKNTTDGGIIKDVSVVKAKELISSGEVTILDIRTPGEFKQGSIPNAINIDFNSSAFASELDKLDKSKSYLVYCRSGNRSTQAMPTFEKLQFQSIYHMSGGYNSWK